MSPEIELDHWHDRYAKRTSRMRTSAVRDLMAVADQPDIIALSGGMPETGVFEETLRPIAEELLVDEAARTLQYGPSQGIVTLREQICDLMFEEGMHVHPDDVLITVGAQQALEFLGKVLLDDGDTVVIEEPSYVGALNAFLSYEAQFETIPTDVSGMDIDALDERLGDMDTPPKFVYVIPNFQNPGGATLSLERRQQLIDVVNKHDVILVEDNPYGRLRFKGDTLPTLRSLDDSVVYLGTFSKIFSPGVRVGWIVAPPALRDRLLHAKQAADLCSSMLNQRLVEEFFKRGLFEPHLKKLIEIYSGRAEVMAKALKKHFPAEATWSDSEGGFFVWAKLPEYLDTTEMLAEALAKKVAYVPGSGFFPDGRGKEAIRLSFGAVGHDKIRQGISVLGEVIKGQMELYESLKF